MEWVTVNNGKYRDKNKSLPQVMFDDPDWFYWMYRNNKLHEYLVSDAEDLFRNSCLNTVL